MPTASCVEAGFFFDMNTKDLLDALLSFVSSADNIIVALFVILFLGFALFLAALTGFAFYKLWPFLQSLILDQVAYRAKQLEITEQRDTDAREAWREIANELKNLQGQLLLVQQQSEESIKAITMLVDNLK